MNKKIRNYLILCVSILLLFVVYTWGIGENPPGFYLDESVLSYNAYLVATTGAGESGQIGTLFFPVFSGPWTQYANPTHIYILAGTFFIFGPSILAARLTAALFMFIACILLGFLGYKISEDKRIGVIVAGFTLLTPWFFDLSRLVLEIFFYPLALILFLWAVYCASKRERWSWLNISAITGGLVLLTYSYTIGRLLAPMLAFLLVVFATNKGRIFDVLKTWILFGITLLPLIIFNIQNPEIRTRFSLISYIKPDSKIIDIVPQFFIRYFQDINPITMLLRGDTNARHHMSAALGSFFISAFVLALIGIFLVVLTRGKETWWRYVLLATFASIVPGAMTIDVFHTLRLIAYPVFLILLTIPALEFFLGKNVDEQGTEISAKQSSFWPQVALGAVLIIGLAEAGYFHWNNYRYGPTRLQLFDANYTKIYEAAVNQPVRPIFLQDGYWGPGYIHAYWYSVLQGRSENEFIHLKDKQRPPYGGVVISTERSCVNCQMIMGESPFILYKNSP